MDGIVSVSQRLDTISRQAMMYLLINGWSRNHTSLAMIPEQCAMNWENWVSGISWGKAFQKQVPLITQGACMAQIANTPMPGKLQMKGLLNGQHVRPHTKSESSLQFGSAHWDIPVS